jgi:hypothetical protein
MLASASGNNHCGQCSPRVYVVLLMTVLLSVSHAIQCTNTSGDWVLGDEYYFYRPDSTSLTWDDARTYCRQLWTGPLDNNPIDLGIMNTSRNLNIFSQNGDRWIGCSQQLNSIEPDFGWTSVDGNPVDFTRTLFGSDEPNDWNGNQACCKLMDSAGRLDDDQCTQTLWFICGIPGNICSIIHPPIELFVSSLTMLTDCVHLSTGNQTSFWILHIVFPG